MHQIELRCRVPPLRRTPNRYDLSPQPSCLLLPFSEAAYLSRLNRVALLYLNAVFSKLRAELLGALVMNRVHAELPRAFQIQRAVVDEKTLFRRPLSDFQRHAKNGFFRFARADVARAEENQKIPSQIKGFDAVLIEFQRLVVEGSDKVFFCVGHFVKDRTRLRVFLGLGEHKSCELFARERAIAVEQRAIEVFIQSNQAAVKSRKRKVVAIPEFVPIEMKSGCGFFSRFVIPTVRQDHAANVPKEGGDFRQVDSPPAFRNSLSRHSNVSKNSRSCKKKPTGFLVLPLDVLREVRVARIFHEVAVR